MKKKHPFRKRWGQNFLRDPNIINKIISLLEIEKSDIVLEVGPGDGALTDILAKHASHIHAVEIDPLLINYLKEKQYSNVSIYNSNILNWDYSLLPKDLKVIGNLPYYISSPILFYFLDNIKWNRMIFMFQKELADRIISKEGSKSYGRISVICQVYCDIKMEFTVSKNVFQPKPDIDSSVLSFYPKKNILPNITLFSKFIKQSFSQRRKKLKNNLAQSNDLDMLGDWASLRPEMISPQDFVYLFNSIYLV